MQAYLNIIDNVLKYGQRKSNRTGIDTLFIPGSHFVHDCATGFPAVTTKLLKFEAVVGELLGFIRGYTRADLFRSLGCNIWDDNANSPGLPGHENAWLSNPNRSGTDDLGRIYGAQWRGWKSSPRITGATPVSHDGKNMNFIAEVEYSYIDQLAVAIDTIINNPDSRRIVVSSWRPDEFNQMALPPCHVLFQFLPDAGRKELHLCWYQRSH